MTYNANIKRHQLEIGDRIAQTVMSGDIDIDDTTIWLRIVDVITEDGETEYVVAFPDGEIRRGTIKAKHVGKFKTAAQFAQDEYDYEEAREIQKELSPKVAGHEWNCGCESCVSLYALYPMLRDYERAMESVKFLDRKTRIEAAVSVLGF